MCFRYITPLLVLHGNSGGWRRASVYALAPCGVVSMRRSPVVLDEIDKLYKLYKSCADPEAAVLQWFSSRTSAPYTFPGGHRRPVTVKFC